MPNNNNAPRTFINTAYTPVIVLFKMPIFTFAGTERLCRENDKSIFSFVKQI